ncbi:spore coat polysaccharide biosynthesis protein SpsF [Thermocatellispora tengchongensis]|uniref:Spore coat polysaccharide biosynthesis protein SpsF n=1 Tax=Thermocatellispora tengchongensis TaxID=1073253 RepID=A0A840PQI0_9ACTN|nr:glycosyltransferase family protein [Thermocatellispora tengchongensis]MBB5139337.1 spore coat polysaccharide biosynthesis protein SpsF [Thermocatellispora tengchongensis]
MRIVGIIQARMGSSRLPGKVLRELSGRSVLGWVVRAARAAGSLDGLAVATTAEPPDDAVAAECARLGVACYRGPRDDVLTRFMRVVEDDARCGAVMRFTADCPLLDPDVIREAAEVFRVVPGLDYLSTSLPPALPRGTDVEIVGREALEEADRKARGYHRAHVTSYVYTHPGRFRVLGLTHHPSAAHLRVTLDTEPDWQVIQRIVAKFGDQPVSVAELIDWLHLHPEVAELNAHVRQKSLQEA